MHGSRNVNDNSRRVQCCCGSLRAAAEQLGFSSVLFTFSPFARCVAVCLDVRIKVLVTTRIRRCICIQVWSICWGILWLILRVDSLPELPCI
jgi:hypothetical protein